jgi:hypothetical protein
MTQAEDGYELIGWIARGMDSYTSGRYSSSADVRVPPKIYRTEAVASRYGKARPVYIKVDKPDDQEAA